MIRVLAIADDLTGALETGAKFSMAGLPAAVATSPEAGGGAAVLVIDTESRHLPPHEAAARVAACAQPAALVYKKTDSTLRGNIAAELAALHQVYGGRIAYVPAYPALGRTVRDGIVSLHGVPLHQTALARDPLNPVHDSDARSRIPLGCDAIVFDGDCDDDIERAAGRILADPTIRIVAGPAAIAQSLARRLGTPAAPLTLRPIGTALLVNGSLSPVSCAQFHNAPPHWRRFHRDHAPGTAPLDIARDTGRAVCRELAANPVDALIVFGGDTAYGILACAGLPLMRPLGEILPGVPVSTVDGRPEFWITKAGAFGTPDLLLQLHRKLTTS